MPLTAKGFLDVHRGLLAQDKIRHETIDGMTFARLGCDQCNKISRLGLNGHTLIAISIHYHSSSSAQSMLLMGVGSTCLDSQIRTRGACTLPKWL